MTDKVEYYRRVNIDYGCDVIVGPAKFAMSEEMMRKSTASISTYCHDTSTYVCKGKKSISKKSIILNDSVHGNMVTNK